MRRGIPLLAATLGGFLLMISVFWVGFTGSDDSLYWAGSSGWLAHVPWLGDTHWALRHTLVIPIAIARAVLGDGLPALLLPSLLCSLGILVVLTLWLNHAAGSRAAALATALIVTNPQFVLLSSIANIDVVECFFILVAFALIDRACAAETPARIWRLTLLSGVCCGLAMLSRETSAFAMVAIGLLFLTGYGMRRAAYMPIFIGFATVVGLEFVYVWWMSGNFFYRSTITLHHDSTTDRWLDQGASVPLLHPLIDPLTMFLFNHNFGLLTWIGVPLAVWLMRRGDLTAPVRRFCVLATTLAIVWTVLAAGAWTELNLAPRYFLLPALLLSALSGIALAALWRAGARRLASFLIVLLIGANVLSISVDYRITAMYGEHVLVDIATRQTEPIHTDRLTLARAGLLLRWKGLAGHVTAAPPGSGDLFFLDPVDFPLQPRGDWIVIERHGLPPSIGQILATHLLPAGTLSRSEWNRLGRGHPDVTLYRLP